MAEIGPVWGNGSHHSPGIHAVHMKFGTNVALRGINPHKIGKKIKPILREFSYWCVKWGGCAKWCRYTVRSNVLFDHFYLVSDHGLCSTKNGTCRS